MMTDGTVVKAQRIGDWWRVSITTSAAGILHERIVTGRRLAQIMRQVRP